jgi:ribosomal protein L11 methyltransferase
MPNWVEIWVPVAEDDAEDVAALLALRIAEARAGLAIADGGVVFWTTLAEHEHALAETRRAAATLAAGGFGIDAGAVCARPAVPEAEWRDAWKRFFRVTRVGRRFVIVPSWESHQPATDDLVLALDPGQAFGTGAHASTQLCLEEMEAVAVRRVTRFLDVGTGSGILAMAAAKLWLGARGTAIDTDATAVAVAAENLAQNGLAGRVACRATAIDQPGAEPDLARDDAIDGRFDLILANIQADVLLALRDAIVARAAPGGTVILSGLLTEQVADVASGFAAAGLAVHAIRASALDSAWSVARLGVGVG